MFMNGSPNSDKVGVQVFAIKSFGPGFQTRFTVKVFVYFLLDGCPRGCFNCLRLDRDALQPRTLAQGLPTIGHSGGK